MRLTKERIEAMGYEGRRLGNGWSRDVRWDATFPGFGVRIYPGGRKVWVLSYRVDGRKRLMSIGGVADMSLKLARTKAHAQLSDLRMVGADPLEVRAEARRGETVRDLAKAYIERWARPRKSTWEKDEQRLKRWILPRWGGRKAKSIARADVATLHARIGAESGPYEANRTLALVGKMFECAIVWGYLDEAAANPARRIEKFRETKRDRWVTPQELPRLAGAIDAQPNVYIRAALWLYLLTGVRKRELLTRTWADVDTDRCELRLAKTKAGRIHYVPLNAPAMEILSRIPRLAGNPHVFPGRRRGQPLVNIDFAWCEVRTAAGVEDVRLHDLRRTVGSWLAQAGASLHLVGRVLNQTSPATTAVYARFGEDHVRAALEEHGRRLLALRHPAEALESD